MPAAPSTLEVASAAFAFSAVSAVVFLAIAIVAAWRRGKSTLALQLGLMSACMFAYNMLEVVYSLTARLRWAWLEYAFASLSAIPTLWLFVGFAGRTRRLAWPLRAAAAYFAVVAIATVLPFARADLGWFPGSDLWSMLMLAGMTPAFSGAGYLLWRHGRESGAEERARTRLLAAALLLGVGGVFVDLVAIAGGTTLRLSAVGLLAASVFVALLVLRVRVFERVTALTFATAALFALVGVVLQLVVVKLAGPRTALLVVGSAMVMLALAAALRPLLSDFSEHRARAAYLTTLGRFAEQMAHDLRNPLAAIVGAGQFLQQERAEGRSLDPHAGFVDMIVERARRIERVIADYQRIGRVETLRAPLDLNAVCERALELAQASPSRDVHARAALAPALPLFDGDRDLLEAAIENLVRNALEAMPDGGELSVVTRAAEGTVLVEVRDSGTGMDARTRERATQEFFTTKSNGTGLGLAFVSRVVTAHGGRLRIESAEGRGTTVRIELPVAPPAASQGSGRRVPS